jgi:hypothetical protein
MLFSTAICSGVVARLATKPAFVSMALGAPFVATEVDWQPERAAATSITAVEEKVRLLLDAWMNSSALDSPVFIIESLSCRSPFRRRRTDMSRQ